MMTNKEKKHLQMVSRLLAKVLRHTPEELDLTLADGGWVEVSTLLAALDGRGLPISSDQLEYIVATNDKKRFSLSADSQRIRAAQGHSVNVALGLNPKEPPRVLFHGTAETNLDSILATGLEPRTRQQVHLSVDVETAVKVGSRHGVPVVLEIDTRAMIATGAVFFQADNGVWLTDNVPANFLRVTEDR